MYAVLLRTQNDIIFINKMTTLDFAIIGIIFIGAIPGFTKGFIKQLSSIVGLIAGLLLARALFASVGEKLAVELGTSVSIGQTIAFFLIWLVVPLTISLLASMLSQAVEAIHLGFINRWLGAGLGVIKFALLTSMIVYFIEYIDSKDNLIQSTTKSKSLLYYPIKDFSGIFIPKIKSVTKQLIDTDIICYKNPINM